jgi:hypothetical protein
MYLCIEPFFVPKTPNFGQFIYHQLMFTELTRSKYIISFHRKNAIGIGFIWEDIADKIEKKSNKKRFVKNTGSKAISLCW